MVGCHAQLFLYAEFIYFDNQSVYFIRQLIPFSFIFAAEMNDSINAIKHFFFMNGTSETQLPEYFQTSSMGSYRLMLFRSLQVCNVVNECFQVAFTNQPGILDTQRSGCSIARVCQRRQVLLCESFIEFPEVFFVDQHFAADFNLLDAILRKGGRKWNRADLSEV